MTQSSACPWTIRTSTQQTLIIKMWIKAENTQRPPSSGRMFLKKLVLVQICERSSRRPNENMKMWKWCLFARNGLEATIMSSQVDSVPYVRKKKWINVNLSKNEKLFHLTIWRPCHNVWWQSISAENQINSNTRSLFFGGTKHPSWNKTLRFLDCCWRPVIEIPRQSSLPIKFNFLQHFPLASNWKIVAE